MARFLVEILINAAGGPKARASFDDVGASAASAAKRVEQAGVQSERSLRRTAEAAERLQNQMEETKASKGLIADLQAMNRRTQEQVAALRQGAVGLERYQQKELEAAQAARILSAQVRAGVSAHSLAGKEIADQIRLHDRLQAELNQTARAQGLASRGTGGGGMSVLVSSARSFMGVAAGVTAAVATIGYSLRALVAEAGSGEAELRQLEAAVISTGMASGFSARELKEYADSLDLVKSSGEITDAMSRLVGYTAIQGDMFKAATEAAIDMSVALKQDLTTSAETVGKALNYPSYAMASLSKQGFRFTEEQKKLIKHFEQTNQIAKAQQIVLDELNATYGGTAAAIRDTLPGALTTARNASNDLIGILGEGLSPVIRSLTEDYITWAQSAEAQEQMAEWGHLLADSLDAVSSAAKILGPLIGAIGDQLKITLGGINLALQALGWLAEKVKFAAGAYLQLARDAGISEHRLQGLNLGPVNVQLSDNMSAVYDLRKAYGELGQAAVEAAEKELAAMAASAEALRQRAAQLRKSEAEAKRQAGQYSDERYEAGLGRASGYAKEATEAEYAAKNLDNIVEGLTGRLKKHAEAAGEATGALGELSDTQEKARKSAQKMMDQLEREASNRVALFATLLEGVEAYDSLRRAQAQAAEVEKVRQTLTDAGLTLTQANEDAIRKWAGAIFDTAQKTDLFNATLSQLHGVLSSFPDSIPNPFESLDKKATDFVSTFPQLKAKMGDLHDLFELPQGKEWATSVQQLDKELRQLQGVIYQLPEDSEAYKVATANLTAKEKELQDQLKLYPGIVRNHITAAESDIRSRLAVAESVDKQIKREIAILRQGKAAWAEYEKDARARSEAIAELGVFSLPKPGADDVLALAEWNRLFSQYNQQLESLTQDFKLRVDAEIAAELKLSLESPREELARFRALIDDLADASKHGGEALLSAAEAERLRARAASEFAAETLYLAQSVFSQLADTFGGFFDYLSRAAQTLQNAQQAQSNWSGLASNLGASAGTAAAFGAAGAFFVVAQEMYKYYKGQEAKRDARRYDHAGLTARHDGQWWNDTSGLQSGKQREFGLQLQRTVEEFARAIGGSIDTLAGLEVRVRRDGKYFEAWVQGEIVGRFESIEEATQAALLGAFQSTITTIRGLDPLVQAGLDQIRGTPLDETTLQEAQDFLSKLNEISEMGFPPMVAELRDGVSHLNSLREAVAQLDPSSQVAIDALKRIDQAQKDLFDSITNQALGIDTSAADAVAALAGLNSGLADLGTGIEEGISARIAKAETALAALGTGPSISRGGGEGPVSMSQEEWDRETARLRAAIADWKKELAEVPKALSPDQFDLGIFTALEPALRKSGKYAELILKYEQMRVTAQYESLRLQLIAAGAWERWAAVWQDLYNQAIGEAGRPPARGGRGGGGGGKDEVRDFIKDKRFELSLDGLTDYQKALKELDRTYDEELKKAGNDKKLRTELLALKEKELQLLKKEQAASTLQNFREFMGLVTPFDQVRKTAADLIKEIEGSPFGDERKARMIGRVLAEVERQLDALALQSTASLFGEMIGDLEKYGVGEETRAQMRQQMAIIEHQLKLFHYRTEIEILRASGRVSAETLAILDEGLRILEGVDLTAPPASPAANDNVPRISMEERRKQANDAASKVAKDLADAKEKAEKEAIDILKKWKDVGRPSIVRDLENLSDELKKVTAVFGETEDVMSAHAQAFSAIIKDYLSPVTDYLKGFDSDPNSSLTGEQQYYRTRDEFRAISQLSPDELMSQLLSGVLDPAAIADLAAQYRERGRGFTAGEGYRAIENEIRTVMESIANLVPNAFSGSPEALQVDFSGMSEVAWKSPEIKGAIEAGNTALLLELRAHNPILRQISAGIGETNRILTSTVFDVRNVA